MVGKRESYSKPIYDLTPLTMLDYPGHLAAIVWFAGCPLRCSYCYNPKIVTAENGTMSGDDLLRFLTKRQGLLDAVVLSGGECTGYPALIELCHSIRKLGYKIKVDSNGHYPAALEALITAQLVDFVALDYKAPADKFKALTGTPNNAPFFESLKLLIASNCPFEVRTTVHSGLLGESDISAIADDLWRRGYRGNYYLQKFVATDTLSETPPQSEWIDLNKVSSPLTICQR